MNNAIICLILRCFAVIILKLWNKFERPFPDELMKDLDEMHERIKYGG